MNASEIKKVIAENLARQNIVDHEVRLQPDGAGRWKVAAIARGFDGLTTDERIKVALTGLNQADFSWTDLLTPEEVSWAGALPADLALEELPLWAEALARANTPPEPAIFASDIDEDLAKPIVVTFYSLRGGVGRSTALVNAARILANRGRKVLVVDMDLEAPGLASLLGLDAEVEEGKGVVSLLTKIDLGEQGIDVSSHLLRASSSDDLYCLPAGNPSADYARQLSFLDPGAWYREDRNPLRVLIDSLRSDLPFQPDFILIDSRTGISPISGPLLFDLPDLAVIVFFPHPQAREGTRALVQAIGTAKSRRVASGQQLTPEPRFLASPVPAGDSYEKYLHRAADWVSGWIAPLNLQRRDRPLLIDSDITHVIPYREALANSDAVSELARDWTDFVIVADWIDRFASASGRDDAAVTESATKERVLNELVFPTGTAEGQEDLLETFIQTNAVRKALDPNVPLVRGRKGTGKTALFRQLTENENSPAIKVMAPQSLQKSMEWSWGADAYREADTALKKASSDWQFFWSFYICLRLMASRRDLLLPTSFQAVITKSPESEMEVIEALDKVLSMPRKELAVGDWIRHIDNVSDQNTILLFDGLDTGFGNTEQDRRRRIAATEGLFSFLTDRGGQLNNLKLKVVLREDIWRQLKFENKSHLFGRDASLTWRESDNFYRVVLVHARRSKSFSDALKKDRSLANFVDAEIDLWSADAVAKAWILLIGERMKGSGTTYTMNWVWNRLADGNDDRNPRYLLMLFNLITQWERDENMRSKYERSIIRPRSLEQKLPDVSRWALDALKEEFEELEPILAALTNERTPFSAELINEIDADVVHLAQEVGLVSVYEQKDGNPERYSVPEIYRHALGMKRKGQV